MVLLLTRRATMYIPHNINIKIQRAQLYVDRGVYRNTIRCCISWQSFTRGKLEHEQP